MKFRKRPVVVDAYQTEERVIIRTLEGDMVAEPGDWVITGVAGEIYPCKPDIFQATYEAVEEGISDEQKDLNGLSAIVDESSELDRVKRSAELWQEEARRLDGNASYWRSRFEEAEEAKAKLQEAAEAVLHCEDCGGTGLVPNPEGTGEEACHCRRELAKLLYSEGGGG